MDNVLVLIIAVIVAGVAGCAAAILLLSKRLKSLGSERNDSQAMVMIQNQIAEITKTLDMKLGQSNQILQEQFGQSAQIVRDVTEKLTKLDETNRQVINFTDQLQNLQDILKNPKQRGILGEYYLETVLKNVLPPKHYQMQYKFNDGEIVDAVIFLQNKILPIDSKFSLENYNRLSEERDPAVREQFERQFKEDLKKRIDETSKYIRPKEGTMDFAFMFIPSEGIYYDILINQVGAVKVNTRDLIEYAFKQRHVIIVSPTSFFAYLQTVLQGLRALEIEQSAKDIIKRVEELDRHLRAFYSFHQKLGANLSTTVNAYNTADREFKKIDRDVIKLVGGDASIELASLDRPTRDE